MRITVLASGRGSNLQAISEALAADRLDAQLVGVFSDECETPALERALLAGVPAFGFSPRGLEYRGRLSERGPLLRPGFRSHDS